MSPEDNYELPQDTGSNTGLNDDVRRSVAGLLMESSALFWTATKPLAGLPDLRFEDNTGTEKTYKQPNPDTHKSKPDVDLHADTEGELNRPHTGQNLYNLSRYFSEDKTPQLSKLLEMSKQKAMGTEMLLPPFDITSVIQSALTLNMLQRSLRK